MTLRLPPLRNWKGTPANRCTGKEILSSWKAHDTITFLVNQEIYDHAQRTFLDPDEREKELRFKSGIAQERFVVSRTILKHILHAILQTGTIEDIVLIRREDGRILVKDVPEIFISLSYSGHCIAITVGKRKMGSDIERIRPVDIRKITSSPLFEDTKGGNKEERIRDCLQVWTLMEAYAKLHDTIPYPYLTWRDLPRDAKFVSYCINTSSIFSLACGQEQSKDALFWLDTKCSGISSDDAPNLSF